METHLSNYIGNEFFVQIEKDRLLYLIIFFFKNLNLIKYNYKIYNKNLLAIICYFEQ